MELEEHWPVTDEDRRQTVQALLRLVAGDDGPLSIRATRLVLQIEELNLRYQVSDARKLEAKIKKLLSSRGAQ
jgi:hypothetical protein